MSILRHISLYVSFFRLCFLLAIFNIYTVKPVFNDLPWDPKCVAVVDRCSLFRGSFEKGGRCRQVVAIQRWSSTQV